MMTELKDTRYLRENNLLNGELFFQLQKLSRSKLQFHVIELNKSMLLASMNLFS